MVAAPAVEVTLGSLPGLETGRTTLYLDTAQHTFAQAFPFFFFFVTPRIPATKLSSKLTFAPGADQSLAPRDCQEVCLSKQTWPTRSDLPLLVRWNSDASGNG